jgi:phosphate transport system protein
VRRELKDGLRGEPERAANCLRLIEVARNLERVGDHAVNIAEVVVCVKEGVIIRHTRAERGERGR